MIIIESKIIYEKKEIEKEEKKRRLKWNAESLVNIWSKREGSWAKTLLPKRFSMKHTFPLNMMTNSPIITTLAKNISIINTTYTLLLTTLSSLIKNNPVNIILHLYL